MRKEEARGAKSGMAITNRMHVHPASVCSVHSELRKTCTNELEIYAEAARPACLNLRVQVLEAGSLLSYSSNVSPIQPEC